MGWELEVRGGSGENNYGTGKFAWAVRTFLAGGMSSGKPCRAEALVAYNACGKAAAVQKQLKLSWLWPPVLPAEAVAAGTTVPIVAADTVVVRQERIMGKPVDAQDAVRMLTDLADGWHQVLTGVAVLYRQRQTVQVVSTAVHFRKLSAAEIMALRGDR